MRRTSAAARTAQVQVPYKVLVQVPYTHSLRSVVISSPNADTCVHPDVQITLLHNSFALALGSL